MIQRWTADGRRLDRRTGTQAADIGTRHQHPALSTQQLAPSWLAARHAGPDRSRCPSRTRCRRKAPTSFASSCCRSRLPPTRLRARARVPPGESEGRAPREHPDRPDPRVAGTRRGGSRARLQRADRALRRLSRRPFSRLDAGPGRAAAAEGSRLALEPQHRSRRRTAHAAERQGESRCSRRSVSYFGDSAADADAGDAAARPAGHRHSRRRERTTSITDSYMLPVDVEVRSPSTARALPRSRHRAARRRCPTARRRRYYRSATGISAGSTSTVTSRHCALPKGTTVVDGVPSTTTPLANPRNPERPPLRARWGQRSSDEMGDLWIQVLTRDDRDLTTLNARVPAQGHCRRREGLRSRDRTASRRHWRCTTTRRCCISNLAGRSMRSRHFQASLAAQPGSAAAHYNLGTALSLGRRLDEAVREYPAGTGDRSAVRQCAQQSRQRFHGDGAPRGSGEGVCRSRAAATDIAVRARQPRCRLCGDEAVRSSPGVRGGRASPQAARTVATTLKEQRDRYKQRAGKR